MKYNLLSEDTLYQKLLSLNNEILQVMSSRLVHAIHAERNLDNNYRLNKGGACQNTLILPCAIILKDIDTDTLLLHLLQFRDIVNEYRRQQHDEYDCQLESAESPIYMG